MKIYMPPAKELDLRDLVDLSASDLWKEPSWSIAHQLEALGPEALMQVYGLSQPNETYAAYWKNLDRPQGKAAIHLYKGLMYRQFPKTWTPLEWAYLQEHVCITSALYGPIRATQPIAPYRLDFNMPFKWEEKSLKQVWRPHFDASLGQEIALSFLSQEFEEVFSPAKRQQLIQLVFLEERGGKLKSHSTISKKARGKFIRALVEGQVDQLEVVKGLVVDNFVFKKSLSEDRKWVFVKKID